VRVLADVTAQNTRIIQCVRRPKKILFYFKYWAF